MAPGCSPEPAPDARGLIAEHGDTLLDVARAAIDYRLAHGRAPEIKPGGYPAALRARRASFVTLFLQQELCGCIGRSRASLPLVADVSGNAVAAAFEDRRFDPLTAREAGKLDIEVSVLDEPRPLAFSSEANLLERLRPGVDGVILHAGDCKALFLPDVWAKLPDARDFMAQLRKKAGLPADHPAGDSAISVFTTASTSRVHRGGRAASG